MRLSVGSSLGLVSDDDVTEGEHLVDLSLEELGDERSREVHGEGLKRGMKRIEDASEKSARAHFPLPSPPSPSFSDSHLRAETLMPREKEG